MQWLCNLLGNTTFSTVLAGVTVFVIGQIAIESFFKPIQKYKKLKADTAFCLWRYRNKFTNGTEDETAHNSAQELAAMFVAYSQEKPFWMLCVTRKNLLDCAGAFIRVSNCVNNTNDKRNSADIAITAEQMIVKTLNLQGFKI